MRNQAAESGPAQAHVELRRARLLRAVDRPLRRVGAGAEPLPPARAEHLRCEAEQLYWNELSWEQLTGEERVAGGRLTEMAFPGFLAFVDGLLVEDARPHPEVVEAILRFLAERFNHFTMGLENGADSGRMVWARAMTARLIDLVLYRLYRLTPEEQEEIEALE